MYGHDKCGISSRRIGRLPVSPNLLHLFPFEFVHLGDTYRNYCCIKTKEGRESKDEWKQMTVREPLEELNDNWVFVPEMEAPSPDEETGTDQPFQSLPRVDSPRLVLPATLPGRLRLLQNATTLRALKIAQASMSADTVPATTRRTRRTLTTPAPSSTNSSASP